MIKRFIGPFLVLTVMVLLNSCGKNLNKPNIVPPDEPQQKPTVPTNANYKIRITGEVNYGGNPSGEPFLRDAMLAIRPGVLDDTQDNGINAVDIAIYTDESPPLGFAGALWFTSNTALSTLFGSISGANSLDISLVSLDEPNGQLTVKLDGDDGGYPRARLATFNTYNALTGLTAQVIQILYGTISLEFINANDSKSGIASVKGKIALGGSLGFSGPFFSSEYIAYFEGELI